LLNPNRNPQFTQQKIEIFLCKKLGLRRIIWLEYGQLPGDDTDGHIDTLVRFAPHNTLVYMTCNNPKDDHYQDFKNLENQLKTLKNLDEQFYRLIPLPWPQPKYDQKGNRLPASYANYLIINNAILVPTYDDQADETALKQIQKAYPNHEIIGIYCLPLIYELGSLHCMTMQLPKGFLK
ncbi:MAG: agmatine deiminase family protein, partial [Crocosphaera sp.]|nr:agmatine deiminase family protein [Crocosphaera sp.]